MIKKIFISLFGLLAFTPFVLADYVIVNGVSYNSYYEFDVGECTQIGNYVYCFDDKGNLFTSDSSNEGLVAYTQWNNGPDYIYAYGRIDGKLYGFAHNTVTQYTPEGYVQGFVSNFCRSDSLVGCAEGSYSYSMEDVINGLGSIQKVYFRIPGGGGLSLPYRNTDMGLFFYDGSYYYGTKFNLADGGLAGLTGSLGFDWTSFSQVVNYSWGNSPLVGGKLEDGYDIDDQTYTYGEIVQGYEACGLQYGYCFGGFPITDIFEPDQTIEDFTGYQFGFGANIWTIYNLYSSTYTPKQFFAQMLQAYDNGQINRFKTEPKALIMFVQQYVSAKSRGTLNVGFYDLWDYCNIKLGYNNLNDIYTGHNQTPKTCYNMNKTNDQNWGGFTFTGENALNLVVGTGGTGFTTAKDFFGRIGSVFQNGIGVVNTNYTGFLPGYIIAFMLAFILIRILSH